MGYKMSSASNQLVIHVSPEALSVALVKKNRILQTESMGLDIQNWDALWADGLMSLDQPIRQLLSRFPTKKFPSAVVLYHSPTVTQQVHSSELGFTQSRETGEIKIRETIGFTNPVESSLLDDSTGKGGGSTSLVYSDREESLRSLYAWLNRSGVQASAFIPTSVATIETTAVLASKVEPETAVFYIGADVSVMAFVNESGLQLIRSAEIGYRKLVDGYMQGIKNSRGEHESLVTESNEDVDEMQACKGKSEAFDFLFEHGIPFSPKEVGGIDLRSNILPVLAPVLQRFCIEVKQTFRFGLGGAEMPKHLILCGPGASIPHMSKAISQHIDMHIQLAKDTQNYEPGVPFGVGTIEHSIASQSAVHGGLLPEIARDAATRSRLNRSLVAGLALAATVMGGEYANTTIQSNQVSELIQRDALRLQAVAEFKQQLESVSTMSGTIHDVSSIVIETVEGAPNWLDGLVDISHLASDSVRIQEVRGEYSGQNPIIEINGYAVADSGKESGEALNAFISSLEAVESVSDVALGATSRISVSDNQWGRQFTMKIQLHAVPLPHEVLVYKKVTTSEWGTP